MLTRLLAASVAGGVLMVFIGFLIYGLFLDPMVMKPNMNEYAGLMKEPPNFVFLILGNIALALLLGYIFEKWAGIRTFAGGLRAGAIIGFLMTLFIQLMFSAFMNLSKNYIPLVADVIGSTVLVAIGGGVVGQILGLMNKTAAAE